MTGSLRQTPAAAFLRVKGRVRASWFSSNRFTLEFSPLMASGPRQTIHLHVDSAVSRPFGETRLHILPHPVLCEVHKHGITERSRCCERSPTHACDFSRWFTLYPALYAFNASETLRMRSFAACSAGRPAYYRSISKRTVFRVLMVDLR